MNIISKEDFVEILTTLSKKRIAWDNLCDAFEKLSPGEYINFWPHFDYENIIMNLLNTIFNFNEEWSPISYFMIEGNFGEEKKNLSSFELDDKTYDISTPEKLYDVCVALFSNK